MDAETLSRILISLVAMILSLSVHEYAHARVAYWLGDDTASREGRLSLNPLVHIDPIGTLLLPVVGSFSGYALIGWAKPVPTNPLHYTKTFGGKRISMNAGLALVAVAGPLSNLLFAVALAGMVKIASFVVPPDAQSPLYSLAMRMMVLNLALMVFNLLPFPPLDGSRVLYWRLPERFKPMMDTLTQNTWIVFMGLLIFMQLPLFGTIFFFPISLLLGLLGSIFGIQSFFYFL